MCVQFICRELSGSRACRPSIWYWNTHRRNGARCVLNELRSWCIAHISYTDASSSWCGEGWICSLHRNVILLGSPVYVEYTHLLCAHSWSRLLVHAMQGQFFASARDDYTERCFSDYAIRNNLTPFISMQNHYNLVYREEEREMFTTLKVPFWFAELLVLMCQVAFWYWGYHMVSLSPRPSISSLRPANKARSIW